MRVAGIPLGVLKNTSDVVLIDLPFTSNINDVSAYSTPMRVVSGSPSFSTGALYLANTGTIVASGASNNEAQLHLDLKNKLYTIEYEFKNSSAGGSNNHLTMLKDATTESINGGSIGQDISGGYRLSVSNASNIGLTTPYVLGYDPATKFTSVKFKRIAVNTYELWVDNVLVRTYTTTSDVFFHSSTQRALGVFFKGFYGVYIKNFKITSNGSV
jgi:hypothetical protein